MIAAFAVAGIVALSGCMSLEERLASSDPRVKNEAEHELIESSRENSDETARIAAVKRISNKDYLYEIAVKANKAEKNSKGGTVNTVKEGLAAVDMLSCEDKMLQLALDAKSDEIRAAAFNKITSDDSFLRLAEKAADAAIRRRAFEKVANEDGFAHIVKCSDDATTRIMAYDKIQDQKLLLELLNTSNDRQLILNGIKRIEDKEGIIQRVFAAVSRPEKAENNSTPGVVYRKGKHGRMIPVPVPANKAIKKDSPAPTPAQSFDKELVDAFIANCSDDTILARVVKNYGEGFTPEQCAAIKAKSNNAEIQNAIAMLSDKKILSEMSAAEKKYREGYKTDKEYRDALESIISMFSQLHSSDSRKQYLANVISKEIHSREDRDFAKALARTAKTDELLLLFKSSDEKVRDGIVQNIAEENVLELLVLLLKDGASWDEIKGFGWFRPKNVEPELMARLLDALPPTIYWHDLESFCKKAKDATLDEESLLKFRPKFKKPMPNPFNTPAQEFADNHTLARRCVQTISQKLTVDAKKRLCSSAREKAEAQKGKAVVFGPFYLGMPYIDALLLQEEIWGAGSGIQIWSNLKGKYGKKELEADHGGEFAMSEIPYVWKISFDNKAKFKFIDCKDSLVLAQFIYQFVEEKSGNVSSDIRYADDIRIETGKDNDMRIYEAYSNTKKGIKVQYCKKDGVLNMVEL